MLLLLVFRLPIHCLLFTLTDVWNQSFIAEYYIKHCSQDITSLKTIIVQQLCYHTQNACSVILQ